MNDGPHGDRGVPTRREYVKYGGAVVGGGLLAGCAGSPGPEPTSTGTTP
ncbi:Fe3+-hydroxamate ABC transporter substrate-binding protein, partial [Halobium palmae]